MLNFSKNYYSSQCKDCIRKYKKEHYQKNSIRIKENVKCYQNNNKEAISISRKEYNKNNIEKYLLGKARNRANKKGIEFNISENDINISEYCPVFPWLKLEINYQIVRDNSPTIDRIDNTKGYTKENIQIISWKANKLKSNGTLKDFEYIVKYMKITKEI